jgi:hypothetical protein
LLKQPSLSREITGLEDLEMDSPAEGDAAAADSSVTDDADTPAAASKSADDAARVAS